ncbi:MAG: Sensor-type histidine kinase PrrB [Actinomycetota bacterium]|jgi:two-component system sensor histidine kinase PrrB
MRIAVRTALAAVVAALVAVLLFSLVARREVVSAVKSRLDRELEDRSSTAPILAAVAERLSQSGLALTVQPSRVRLGDTTFELGGLPAGWLPAVSEPGWRTVVARGERWRALTVEVRDVPEVGDRALVQVLEPLAGADAALRRSWRALLRFGVLAVLVAGVVGYLLGLVAARPLARLRRDAAGLDPRDRRTWSIGSRYGAVEVDEVASALDDGLRRLGAETERSEAALAAARSFAASAAHELRTPLQGAILNLDVARDARTDEATRLELIALSLAQVQRMGASLSAVRALGDAEVADEAWFERFDLADLVDAVVADEVRRFPGVQVVLQAPPDGAEIHAWRDGVQLAVSNMVRNALVHGRPAGGDAQRIEVLVSGSEVVVDDNGRGVPVGDRQRVLRRFERASNDVDGAGLGLAICLEVAQAHGGSVVVGESPVGGARVTLRLGPA